MEHPLLRRMCLVSAEDAAVREPAPAPVFMAWSIDKHTVIRVIITLCDKSFNKKSREAVGATARNAASVEITQNTCSSVAYSDEAHSSHVTLKMTQTQNSADIDKPIN